MVDDREKTILARARDHVSVRTDASSPVTILFLSVGGVREELGALERRGLGDGACQTAGASDLNVQLRHNEPDFRAVDDRHCRGGVWCLDDGVSLVLESCAEMRRRIGRRLNEQNRVRIHDGLGCESSYVNADERWSPANAGRGQWGVPGGREPSAPAACGWGTKKGLHWQAPERSDMSARPARVSIDKI